VSVLTPDAPETDRPDDGSTTVPDPRIEARRAEVHAATVRRVRRVLVALLAAAAMALAAGLALISPLLDVDRVVVLGAPDLDAARLVSASGVRLGQATYSVDPAAVERRLARLGEVADVTARVRWPGEVELRVTPRPVLARVVGRDDVVMTVGRGGFVLDESAILPVAVPEVRVPDLDPVDIGRRLPDPFRRAVEVAGALPLPVRLRVSGASVDAEGRIVLERTEGGQILVGEPVDVDAKMRTIETMLSGRAQLDRLCLLDVRDPQAAVLRRAPDCNPPAPEPPAPDPAAVPASPPVATQDAAPGPDWGSPGQPEPDFVEPQPEVQGT